MPTPPLTTTTTTALPPCAHALCTLSHVVAIPLTSPISLPLLAEGGQTGASFKDAAADVKAQCGVFIGRWRPSSKVDPHLRARVAVKVMEQHKSTNDDIPHLLTMNFPYVNHFRGQFCTSQQLQVADGSCLTIMVSSYCAGGDHFSAISQPVQAADSPTDPYSIHLQFVQGSGFCFGNPDFSDEEVNHGINPCHVEVISKNKKPPHAKITTFYRFFSFVCVFLDPASPSTGIICRVERRGERFFQLFCSGLQYPQCNFPYDASAPRHMDDFTQEFVLPPGAASAACCMLFARTDDQGGIGSFEKCMPRPNAPFLRAFAVQLLRAVGYCHSRKLKSHNGEQ